MIANSLALVWPYGILGSNAGFPFQDTDTLLYMLLLVDGAWSAWTEWTNCSVTCWSYRSRECDDPAPLYFGLDCVGDYNQSMRCRELPCDG